MMAARLPGRLGEIEFDGELPVRGDMGPDRGQGGKHLIPAGRDRP
jgi:hypothetical protein